jgi:hypothetical protein
MQGCTEQLRQQLDWYKPTQAQHKQLLWSDKQKTFHTQHWLPNGHNMCLLQLLTK